MQRGLSAIDELLVLSDTCIQEYSIIIMLLVFQVYDRTDCASFRMQRWKAWLDDSILQFCAADVAIIIIIVVVVINSFITLSNSVGDKNT